MTWVLVAVTALFTGTLVYPPSLPVAAATMPLSSLLDDLVVAAEQPAGYDRDLFDHWIDADGDGCDTRREVLIAESVVTPTVGAGCSVVGSWHSWFDDATWTDPSDVDIDHLVPLSEAWASGARHWTSAQRRAFANDLDIDQSLAAVTDSVNQSKGDKDPAEWMPPDESVHCRYVQEWIVVKHRWRLTVDTTEAELLTVMTSVECGDPVITVPPPGGTPVPVPGFSDVPASHPFADDIAWMAAAGVGSGYPDGTFGPGAPVSRGAMAAFLYRYTKGPAAPVPTCPRQWFPDVPKASSMCGYIWWLASTGITSGYADGRFRPTEAVSRQAMAAFLQRYRKAAAPTSGTCTPTLFSDMPVAPFCGPVTWLAGTDITGGYTDGTFRPTASVGRGAMAAFLHRFDDRFGPSDPPVVVSPPTTTTTRPSTTRPPTTAGPPPNPGDSKNCGDFATWAQAQAWFDKYYPFYGDVARLDGDGDGIACESLPGAP